MTANITGDMDYSKLEFKLEDIEKHNLVNPELQFEARSTKECLRAILKEEYDKEVKFLVPRHCAREFVSRIRTALSRGRDQAKQRKMKIIKFKLYHSSTVPHEKFPDQAEWVIMVRSEGNASLSKSLDDLFQDITWKV